MKETHIDESSWENVDDGLFEALRSLRRKLVDQRCLPAYVLVNDATVRDMVRLRPGSPDSPLNIRGVGEKKMADIGQPFLEGISNYCREKRLELDL